MEPDGSFIRAPQLSLSWTRSIHCMPPHLTSWRSILILFSHLRLGLSSCLFSSCFLTKFFSLIFNLIIWIIKHLSKYYVFYADHFLLGCIAVYFIREVPTFLKLPMPPPSVIFIPIHSTKLHGITSLSAHSLLREIDISRRADDF